MTYSIWHSTKYLEIFLGIVGVLAILLAFRAPRLGNSFFLRLQKQAELLFRKPLRAVVLAAFMPLLIRLMLLPVLPIPVPRVHDEFSYLLLGDTLAHGRLANPAPPFWQHFETEYELVRPTYASQYQPAQGLALAAGQIAAGQPWWGVWLTTGLLFGALCWALDSILPRRWAFFGSMIAALQFGIYGFWMNSYFGGAVAGIGGALVFGSLTRRRSLHPALTCGLGLVILLSSRPLEGLIWLAVALLMMLRSQQKTNWFRPWLVFSLVLLAGVSALAFYNKKITGNALTPPYELYRQQYGTPQSYWIQPAVIVTTFNNPQLQANYQNQLEFWNRRTSPRLLWNSTSTRLRDFWRFFIGPLLTPALLFVVGVFRRKPLRPWLWVSAIFILDHAAYHAWYPQQSSSETVLIVLLFVEGWRHMRAWKRSSGVGRALSRNLSGAFVISVFLLSAGLAVKPVLPASWSKSRLNRTLDDVADSATMRSAAIQTLEQIPGKHLVFVHYEPNHHWYDEWVFNDADMAASRIVFARMLTPESNLALARSMSDRDLWIADPDAEIPLARMPGNR